ncbi:amidohydrolase [Danxiaibacter flavus]|uniref:Amidohydrolase n=1 Tax=Danxiaibacter flavus TaxID=3049108 RepID=A0ABV3ZLU5_9BACT|nr:amidohydrolase [Chitinophagaceae bacterium DXS]
MKFIFITIQLLIFVTAGAQKYDAELSAIVKGTIPGIIEIRHKIHQHPELSNCEFKTSGLVADYLQSLGIEITTGVARTGVVGIMKGTKPGKTIALRADMDALPVTEQTNYSFKSTDTAVYNGKNTGVMHACGHDIHTSVMLGVAKVLTSMKDKISGTVLFIFQPAEENLPAGEEAGAKLMLKEGLFDKFHPDAIFGIHSNPALQVGQIGYSLGAANASSSTFTFTIIGKSAHAASPELSVDPVVVSAQVVLALQTIRSRNFEPFEPSVITVAQIHGGIRDNIIPSEVVLSGTVRLLNPRLQDEVQKRFREILEGTTRAAGGSYRFDYRRGAPVNMNDSALQLKMLPTMERIAGKRNVQAIHPWMAADDYAYFAERCPSFFFSLGTTRPGTISGGLHTGTFMGDDDSIEVGIKTVSALVIDFLSGL